MQRVELLVNFAQVRVAKCSIELSSAESEEEERRGCLFFLEEWWRWVDMKVGFWMRDFHVLQTELQVRIDLIGRRIRISVWISGSREFHNGSSVMDLETSSLGK
ncbi:hypothetical protein ACB098_06G063000 [Castanea mollissima]